jgi:hypothetical protein
MAIVTHTAVPETSTPQPRYTPLAPPPPIDVCITFTPQGEECTQPEPPLPTPTPVLPCPVPPGNVCIHPGGAVRHLTPTPVTEQEVLP